MTTKDTAPEPVKEEVKEEEFNAVDDVLENTKSIEEVATEIKESILKEVKPLTADEIKQIVREEYKSIIANRVRFARQQAEPPKPVSQEEQARSIYSDLLNPKNNI